MLEYSMTTDTHYLIAALVQLMEDPYFRTMRGYVLLSLPFFPPSSPLLPLLLPLLPLLLPLHILLFLSFPFPLVSTSVICNRNLHRFFYLIEKMFLDFGFPLLMRLAGTGSLKYSPSFVSSPFVLSVSFIVVNLFRIFIFKICSIYVFICKIYMCLFYK
jgi:hypothetical protein